MFDDLETKIILLLYKNAGTILQEQLVDYLHPDKDELDTALCSLLSDALITETQAPGGKRQFTVNMDEKEYRLFFTQELIDKMYGGDPEALMRHLVHYQNKSNLAVLGKIQEELIALSVSAAQGQTLHDRLYQAMLAVIHAFDTSPLYRNAYADNPVISADTDKERKSWGQVLSEICHAVGLENPVPMVVFEYYFGVLEILHRSKEKISSADKADEVTDAMGVMLHHIADYLEKH